MKKEILIYVIVLLTCGCVSKKNLLIEENELNQERLNKTTLKTLKIKHPFAKREKSFKSIMWRTDEGRYCEMVYNESLTLKSKGVKLKFLYSGFDKKNDRTIREIEFYKNPYFLKNGIKIDESKLSSIDSLYDNTTTEQTDKYIVKKTDDIWFFSFYSNNDSIETNMVINKIEIK